MPDDITNRFRCQWSVSRVAVQPVLKSCEREIHHRDTEDAEVSQSKEITESRFEISNLFSEIGFLCAPCVCSGELNRTFTQPSANVRETLLVCYYPSKDEPRK